ncbi:MAG: ferrous iron transporter B [Thiothrix sp.]|nr:MAG: ferrous iron transporter B [Thiothrix sp.]
MGKCCDYDADTGRSILPGALNIALAGNPNCGKSALFNAFTGIRQKTGNWPGVTVERKEGRFRLQDSEVVAIDLPGIYSLDAGSLDEAVTRDYLLSQQADVIVNVIDATNLERNLYLTVQMLEMDVPMVVALNMMDVAKRRGVLIDTDKLSKELGCPVVPVVAVKSEGLAQLKEAIAAAASGSRVAGYRLAHEETIEQAITDLIDDIQCEGDHCAKHWMALKMLEGDAHAMNLASDELKAKVEVWQKAILDRSGEEADIHIANSRFSHAHALVHQVLREKGKVGKTMTDRIDHTVLSRWLGIPIFMLVMYLMFMFSINIGGAFIDFFDGVAGALFVDGFGGWIDWLGSPQWLTVLLANGVGGGLQVVATFIPIIAALYLFLSVIEDSGYMARAAFVMDRAMRAIGLPGKAFVPLIVGFGCNVPAIMATRTLENERERKLTILMNPFMSCGARLPVYALFAAAFFPNNGQNVVFALYLIGIMAAIGTGLVMKRTLLPGQSSGFMMELPPYHLPTIKGVLLRTWDRLKLFLKEAGQVIVVMVVVINALNSIGTDGSFGNEDTEKSVLSAISQVVTPIFSPMGISEDNWPATVGIFTGVLAKEVVVGALNSLYTALAEDDSNEDEELFNLWSALGEAAATVPENLSAVRDNLLDPIGLGVGDIASQGAAAKEQEVNQGIFGAMLQRFDGRIGAFAYLLFILMYFPCAATIGVIVREAGLPWALFVATWTTGVAYITATLFYQLATFSRHPASSIGWVIGLGIVALIAIFSLRKWANRKQDSPQRPAVEMG